MHKRKSSGRKSNEDDDFEEHSRGKIPKLEESLEDDDDDDDDEDDEDGSDDDDDDDGDEDGSDDDGDDDDDEEDEEDDSKNTLKNQREKSNSFNKFFSQDERETKKEATAKKGTSRNFAYNYMVSYGYKAGSGLGKFENGIIEPVEASKQKGTRGLGFQSAKLEEVISKYDPTKEDEIYDEEVIWLVNDHCDTLNAECLESWVKYGPPKTKITEDTPFCDPQIVGGIIKSKVILDNLTEKAKINGRRRSNPFESIRNAIFLNRAAMKMANMDAILDRMFTEPKTKGGEEVVGPNELLYFADVCAGPGGFSEYVLYRKKWRAKGFGFTLKGENDFKLEQFIAGPSETFQPYYGVREDGDVFLPKNITSFRDHVMKYTDNIGVHFMMADGGIPIEKKFCKQEIICKKLYLCQCIVALLIVRPGGHFVVKLFDLFTEFSVGLIYLMYRSFEEILILKPHTSRPANSERYLVCKWKREDCRDIGRHLFEINQRVPKFNFDGNEKGDFVFEGNKREDVLELVPTDVLENDEKFFNYIKASNNSLGERQIKSLLKMAAFSENTELVDLRQQKLRKECLEKWNIPDEARAEPKKFEPRSKWMELIGSSTLCESDRCNKKNKVTSIESFKQSIGAAKYSWNGIVLCQEESNSTCGFYLGLGKNNVHRYSGGKWTKLNSIGLCLPANTILYGEVVQEFLGAERSQRKIQAFHIIDGLFLGDEDIRRHSFQERGEMITLFAKALFKETCPVRLKDRYLLGDMEQLWDRLVWKKTKSCMLPCLGIPLGEDSFYKAVGVMFVKDMKGTCNRYRSKTHNQLFVVIGKEKIFENDLRKMDLFRSAYADFEESFLSRLIWWWDEGVVIHESPRVRPDPKKMQWCEVKKLLDDLQR